MTDFHHRAPTLWLGEKFTLALDAELYERLEAYAARDERTKSTVIRRALRMYLDLMEGQASTVALFPSPTVAGTDENPPRMGGSQMVRPSKASHQRQKEKPPA